MGSRVFVRSAAVSALLLSATLIVTAQGTARGTLTGTITADKGQVVGFRVAAHNLDRRIWYTVFTNKGRYTVPQALPGRYELIVNEPGYESPTISVRLAAGESKSADVAVKRKGAADQSVEDEMLPANRRGSGARKIVYVDSMEEIFPAGPGQDLMKALCTGCHRDGGTFGKAQTRDDFLRAIEKSTETGPAAFPNVLALGRTPVNRTEKALLADYLVKNFGTGQPERRLRVDPLVVNEEVASKAIYVGYDIPDDLLLEPSQGPRVGAPMIDGEVD